MDKTRPYLARTAKWWITGAAILLLYGTANAQTPKCLFRDVLVATLESNYGERQTAGGLKNILELVEIWSSDSGSFTVFITRANGVSCVIASGQNWRMDRVEEPEGEAG